MWELLFHLSVFYQKFTELKKKITVTITECKHNFSVLFTPLLHIIIYAECIAYPVYFRNTQSPCISIFALRSYEKRHNKIITHGLYGLP